MARKVEDYKMHKIEWCEGGLQLVEIATKNVGENGLNPRMKYIMVRLDRWYRTIVHKGWQETGESMEKCVLYESTRLSWGLNSISLKC